MSINWGNISNSTFVTLTKKVVGFFVGRFNLDQDTPNQLR